MSQIRYAKGPVVYLHDMQDRKKKVRQLLWGDWVSIEGDIDAEWSEVAWTKKQRYAIRKKDYQKERLLELIFLDVGQGDGCVVTTPSADGSDRVIVVDAGAGDNMERYLGWRLRDREFKFHAAVVTHPDLDHYKGFQAIFENPQFEFENVYHNGLIERVGEDLLGPVERGYLTDIRPTQESLEELLSDPKARGRKLYPKLMWTALSGGRVGNVAMLSTEHGAKEKGRTWMPGFAPSDDSKITIEVLGPVVEDAPNGNKGLRAFGKTVSAKGMDPGKTKNGHSVLLRLTYRDFTILFGGDLNLPSETFLLRHYGFDGKTPKKASEVREMVKKARKRLAVDVMKSCHHGSSDVTDEFLEATSPAAFVISSGDEEGHVHPRPDLLGLLGKKGRGNRPLVLSTELSRSTREREDPALRIKLDKLIDKALNEEDAAERKKLKDLYGTIHDELFKRNVSVYGAINVRTDGDRAVVAFLEETASPASRWFFYELEKDDDGVFQVKSIQAPMKEPEAVVEPA